MNSLELLDFLSRCSIEYGIFDANGEKVVDATVYNTDNSITIKQMKVRDIMYLTEYGSLTIPGRRVLDKSSLYIRRRMKELVKELVVKSLEKDINESYIISEFEKLCLHVRDYIRNYIIAMVAKVNKIGSLISTDEDKNRYLYNMLDLSKYIECRLKIRN